MAFRELTEIEVNVLSERQKQIYLEELELYNERCAFVKRIEELENVEYPEIKPKYVFLPKIKANKVKDISDLEKSKIVLDKVFSPKIINGKENAGQLERITEQLEEKCEIRESDKVIIAKTLDNQYDIPKNEKIILPAINVEEPDSEVDFNFAAVELSDILELVTEADILINEIKYENIEVESNVSINTSHPEIVFDLEKISDVNIDLSIKDDYISPNNFEFNESKVEIENTKVFMLKEEKIEVELPKEVLVEKEDVLIAVARDINFGNVDKVQLAKVEKKVFDTPIIDVKLDNDNNKVELTNTTNVDIPKVVEVVIDDSEVSIENPIVATANVIEEFIFEDKEIENNVNTVVSVASNIEFSEPKLIVNEDKIHVQGPISIDEGDTDKIMQIISSMGDTYEKDRKSVV